MWLAVRALDRHSAQSKLMRFCCPGPMAACRHALALPKLARLTLLVSPWLPQRPGIEEAARSGQWELAERLAWLLAEETAAATARAGLLDSYVSGGGGRSRAWAGALSSVGRTRLLPGALKGAWEPAA